MSTMLRYLPAYFEFKDDSERDEEPDSEQAMKQLKRQKVQEKELQFASLLKPLNIQDCDFTSFPDPDLQPKKPFTKLKGAEAHQLYKLIDGEYFIDNASMKFNLRPLNLIDLEDLDILLVSTFHDLYGLPFITKLSDRFRGKIYMTQPLAQMGKHLLEELVYQNQRRNLSKDVSSGNSYFKTDRMNEVFAKMGIEEWQDLYNIEDVEECFAQHVKVLSYNETHTIDNIIKVTALSSGMHIGSCNWTIEVGQQKFGILGNTSEEGDFRHPLYFNSDPLKNLDLLLVSSIARQSTQMNFSNQLKQFFDKLQNCLGSSVHAKVLLPAQSPLILEILDLLIHKISDRVKIIFIADSASQIIQYANINVEYLNLMLQKKIYQAEDPFSFDKLFKENRLLVFSNIEQYLEYKKERSATSGMMTFDDFTQEVIIASSPTLRLGDSVYWLHNLNKHQAAQSFMIITDPRHAEDPLLLKPLQRVNQLKVLYSPIDPNMTIDQITALISKLEPKRVVVPGAYVTHGASSSKISIKPSQKIVLETLAKGERLVYSEQEIGKLKYQGLVPTTLVSQFSLKAKGQAKVFRLKGMNLEFQDNKYQITHVEKGKQKEGSDKKCSLFFKMLEVKHRSQEEKIPSQPLMIKLNNGISLDKCLNQLRVTLAQHGLKNDGHEADGTFQIRLEEHDCTIEINHRDGRVNVTGTENLDVIKKVSDIIKKVLKLI